MQFEIITASRHSPDQFQTVTALGRSLVRIAHDSRLSVRAATSNSRGLPLVYNDMLDSVADDSILVFVHDDVWIDDYYLIDRVAEGLDRFDIIGLAGNRRRLPGQPAWHFTNMNFQWDEPEYLSGMIAHGNDPGGTVQHYGIAPAACELLDGVFLAAKKHVLARAHVRFDTRFDFHFYDLDFCRTARNRGLTLGTWPISVTHQGTSLFGTPKWRQNYDLYQAKWGN